MHWSRPEWPTWSQWHFFFPSSLRITSAILYLWRAINGGRIANPPVSLPWISSPSVLFGYLCLVDGWTALPSCRAALISATYGRSTPTALRLSRQHGSAVWLSKCVSPEGKLNSSKECGGVCVCASVCCISIQYSLYIYNIQKSLVVE